MKSKKLLVLVAGSLLTLAACGPGGDTTSTSSGSTSTPTSTSSSTDPTLANGVFDYSHADAAKRTDALGALEKWAVEKKLTGITLFEDGGYTLYSPDVEKGAPAYIQGYGFGTLAEGRITKDLEGETDARYKRYYHTYGDSDPSKILYMDDDGGVVSGLVSYVSDTYFTTIMNETKDGYKWVNGLSTSSTNRPLPVGEPDEFGCYQTYRVPLNTSIRYSTLSQVPALAAFNNRQVALDDYLVPYQIYYTKAYGMRRNSEIKDKNAGSIKGSDAYLAASKDGFNPTAWENLGIKTGHSTELGDYLEFTFNSKYNPFWAMYYLNGELFAPVPREFISTLGGGDFTEGVKLWGKFNSDSSWSPVDTYLSTGPYVLEDWQTNSKIVYKRNPNFVSSERKTGSYHIEGVYYDIITGLKQDTTAALNKFEANQLHACGVPSKVLEEYVDDPRVTLVPGSSTTKLNLNTCDEETWEKLFGVAGTITQTAPDKYWDLKPCMQNEKFIDGLNFCIDRKSFATKLGATPSCDYFGSAYFSDAENGIYYNQTQQHKDAVKSLTTGTDGYGYSLQKAQVAFQQAATELVAAGDYNEGDTIHIEMAWMANSQEDTYAKPLAKMIEDAFNGAQQLLTLKVDHWYAADYTEVYYDKMMVGQFDIGYGGIEGNTYDSLNFMEVLKSDNSSTFTLNWGIDTNTDAEIEFDGKLWTYDALWEVADHGGYVENGLNSPLFKVKGGTWVRNADGSLTVFVDVNLVAIDEETWADMEGICIYATTSPTYADYDEYYSMHFDEDGNANPAWVKNVTHDGHNYAYSVTFDAEEVSAWLEEFPDQDAAHILAQGIDVYVCTSLLGQEKSGIYAGTAFEALIPSLDA